MLRLELPEFPEDGFSPDQHRAITRAAAFLTDRAQKAENAPEQFAILGQAGSGKTHLLSALVRALSAAGAKAVDPDFPGKKQKSVPRFAVVAPTNKAASVLRLRGVAATTLHRIIYSPVYDPAYEAMAEWLAEPESSERPDIDGLNDDAIRRGQAFFQETKSAAGAFVVMGLRVSDFLAGWTRNTERIEYGFVDESSMLDPQQLEDLRDVFHRLVLFGDPAQLAPIGAGGEMVFHKLGDNEKSVLTANHRQIRDNPIIALAHRLLEPDCSFFDFEDELQSAAARDDRVQIARNVDAALAARAPVLVWRNATRIRLIHAFRQAYALPADQLMPGEPLVCDGVDLPKKHYKKRLDLEQAGLVRGTWAIFLGAGKRAGFAKIHLPGVQPPRISVAAIINIEQTGGEDANIPIAARMGAVFVHGAASTIHKAQGSQWRDVQIFAPDLRAAAQSGRMESGIPLWKRLAYVALTRAEHRVHWVTRYALARPKAPLGTADLLEKPENTGEARAHA